MAWTGRFPNDLMSGDRETYLERPVQLLICTRPSIFGIKTMPSTFVDEATRGIGFSTLPPRTVPGIDAANVINWNVDDPYSQGGDVVSYTESAQSIALRTWKPKAGGFSFEVLRPGRRMGGSEAWSLSGLRRGMLVEVFAGYEGYSFEEYQRINLGVIASVSRAESSIVIKCQEAWTFFLGPSINAWETDAPKMFHGAGRQFTTYEAVDNDEIEIDYLTVTDPVIDASPLEDGTIRGVFGPPYPTTVDKKFFCLQVADRASPTGKNVYLRAEHVGGKFKRVTSGGVTNFDWFYHGIGDDGDWMFDGRTVIDFEAVMSILYTPNPMTDAFSDGLTDCLQRILVSTGKYDTPDQNGPFDTLHQVMGFGLPYQLLDFEEARAWHKKFPKRDLDEFKWTPFFTAEADDGWNVIESALSHFGIWLCLRQGQYTLRSAISHSWEGEGTGPSTQTINDHEIVSVKRHDFFSSSCRVEHTAVESQALENATPPTTRDLTTFTQDDPGTGAKNIATRPFTGSHKVSVADGPLVKDNPITPTARTCWPHMNKNEDKFAAEFVSLQYEWYTRIPEVVELELAGLRFAQYVPGDVLTVNSDLIEGPHGKWQARPAMVQSIRRDWMRGRVTVTLASIPPTNR